MQMYYILQKGDQLDIRFAVPFDSLQAAKQAAEIRKRETGIQYNVILVKDVWTTQTVAELRDAGAFVLNMGAQQ
jgi:hypothetical protein